MPRPAARPRSPLSPTLRWIPPPAARFLLTCLAATLMAPAACRHEAGPLPEGPSVATGLQVTMHYTVRLRDDTLVGTTVNGEPFSFVHGRSDLLPALERGLTGLRPGEHATLVITAREAFGPYNDAKVEALPRDQFPREVTAGLEFEDQIGRTLRVVEVGPDTVRVDWNHPLAGKDLIVDVTIVDVRRPPAPVPPSRGVPPDPRGCHEARD